MTKAQYMIKLKIINAFSKDHPKITGRLVMLIILLEFISTLAIIGIVMYESKDLENRNMAIFVLLTCGIYGAICRINEELIIIQAVVYSGLCILGHFIRENRK